MKQVMMLVMVLMLTITASYAQNPSKPDPSKAQNIVTQTCAACHGMDGNSTSSANPSIAGQHAAYVSKQLQKFKSGERKSPIMGPVAAKLSTEDIINLGAYFSEQKTKSRAAKNKELVEIGQKLYRGGNAATGLPACAACHAPNGAGIPSQYPRLAGQHADYTLAQLKSFRNGERESDKSAVNIMAAVTQKMTDQEMKAVSEYIAGLR